MEILSYILSLLGMASMITASLIKGEKMKKTLFFVFCANALIATSYLVGGSGLNGEIVPVEIFDKDEYSLIGEAV